MDGDYYGDVCHAYKGKIIQLADISCLLSKASDSIRPVNRWVFEPEYGYLFPLFLPRAISLIPSVFLDLKIGAKADGLWFDFSIVGLC